LRANSFVGSQAMSTSPPYIARARHSTRMVLTRIQAGAGDQMRFKFLNTPVAGLGIALTLVAVAATAATPATPVASSKPTAKPAGVLWPVGPSRYEDAPEPWRSYLIQARAADAIADPMQRCLAFPPIPGSQWPAKLLPAHCEWAFGFDDFSLDMVRKSLDAGDLGGLEKRYRELQERHFSETDFSEQIHHALDIFDASYESGALSKRWNWRRTVPSR
jgi:hypothetical protein